MNLVRVSLKLAIAVVFSATSVGLAKQQPQEVVNLLTGDSEQEQVLFDFPCAGYLHRFFDLSTQGNSSEAATAWLKTWEENLTNSSSSDTKRSGGRWNPTDEGNCRKLISLLRLENNAQHTAIDAVLSGKDLSWSLLLAIEQIDVRSGKSSNKRREGLEQLVKERCERFLISYVKGVYTHKQISGFVCQASARISNELTALKLLDQTATAMQLRGSNFDIPLHALRTERLVMLAADKPEEYREKAIESCRKLCDLLLEDKAHQKAHPLALAKARYTLAKFETTDERKLPLLTSTLKALCDDDVTNVPTSERWIWEAQRELTNPEHFDDQEKATRLLKYRLQMLRVAVLLDRFRILRNLTKPADTNSLDLNAFEGASLIHHLQQLDILQRDFNATAQQKLVTTYSLALALKSESDPARKLESDAATVDALNRAMKIAWSLTARNKLAPDLLQLVLECQVEWLEHRVKTIGMIEPSLPRMEDVQAWLKKNLPENLPEYHALSRRRRAAELAHLLFSQKLGDILEQFETTNEDDIILDSLKLLLAIRDGDLPEQCELYSSIQAGLLSTTKPKDQLLPFYALSELELDQNLVSNSSKDLVFMVKLRDALEKCRAEKTLTESNYQELAAINHLQFASMAAHYLNNGTDNKEHRVVMSLEDTVLQIANHYHLNLKEAPYRELLIHLAGPQTLLPAKQRIRANIALASDQLASVKREIADQRSAEEAERIRNVQKLIDEIHLSQKDFNNKQQELLTAASKTKDATEHAELKLDYVQRQSQHEAQAKISQRELLEQYDQIFRYRRPSSFGHDKLLENNLKRLMSQQQDEVTESIGLSGLSYNARCIALESALLIGVVDGDTIELMDKIADSLPQDALKIRGRWKSAKTQDADRIFDQYQLGFELSVQWFASRNESMKALQVAAWNTNRSLAEFISTRNSSDEDSSELKLEQLPPNFIAYFSGNESLHVFWRFNEGKLKRAESEVNRQTLAATIKNLLTQYADQNSRAANQEDHAKLLSLWLLPKPLCDDLVELVSYGNVPCVYVCPHGPLFRLPLEGLSTDPGSIGLEDGNRRLLGDCVPLVYMPSLVSSGRERKTPPSERASRLLTIQPGEDVGNESIRLAELAQSNDWTAQRLVPSGQPDNVLTYKESILENLSDEAGWQIVHFGCHAADDTKQLDSKISLSKHGEISSTELRSKFPTKSFSAKHVFLSACETGSTDPKNLTTGGNTLKTLSTTFLAIGAGDVIASHWKVDQPCSQTLFETIAEQYFERQQNQPPNQEDLARMLFNARKEIRFRKRTESDQNDWSRPFYWNAFTIWTLR